MFWLRISSGLHEETSCEIMAIWTVHTELQSSIYMVGGEGPLKNSTYKQCDERKTKQSNIAGTGFRFSYLELTLESYTIRSVQQKKVNENKVKWASVDDVYLAAHPWFTEFLHIDIPIASADTKQISSCLYTWPKNEIYAWTNKSNNNKLKSRKTNTKLRTLNGDSFAIKLEHVSHWFTYRQVNSFSPKHISKQSCRDEADVLRFVNPVNL